MGFLDFLRDRTNSTWNLIFQGVILAVVFTDYFRKGASILGATIGAITVTALAYVVATAVIYGVEYLWGQYSAKR